MNQKAIDRFKQKTKYNIIGHLINYNLFVKNEYPLIIDFYSGKDIGRSNAFKNLANLQSEAMKISNLYKQYQNKFDNYMDWELLDILDNIKAKLATIENTSKYLRSSIKKGTYGLKVTFEYVTYKNETLEKVSNKLKSINPQNDWVEIAMQNDLLETDYDTNGGESLQVSGQNTRQSFFLSAVVDNLEGEKVYGKDLQAYLRFEDDDLKTISYKDTVLQSVMILLGLKRGDIPEFLSFGLDSRLSVGNSLGAISFPSIIRQMQQIFSSDDTLNNFQIRGIKFDQGQLAIDIEVNTKYDLIVQQKTNL